MEGELAGKKGLVPSNMIEEITDADKLQSLVVDNVNNGASGMYVHTCTLISHTTRTRTHTHIHTHTHTSHTHNTHTHAQTKNPFY